MRRKNPDSWNFLSVLFGRKGCISLKRRGWKRRIFPVGQRRTRPQSLRFPKGARPRRSSMYTDRRPTLDLRPPVSQPWVSGPPASGLCSSRPRFPLPALRNPRGHILSSLLQVLPGALSPPSRSPAGLALLQVRPRPDRGAQAAAPAPPAPQPSPELPGRPAE